jgi:hypothetical protein
MMSAEARINGTAFFDGEFIVLWKPVMKIGT